MNQTRWNYPLNQQNLLIIHFNAWLIVTTKGCKAVSLSGQAAGWERVCPETPCHCHLLRNRGGIPVPRGLSRSTGLPWDHWCVCRFTLSAADGKKARRMQNAVSPDTWEMPLRLWFRLFCFFPPKIFTDKPDAPRKVEHQSGFEELLVIRSKA